MTQAEVDYLRLEIDLAIRGEDLATTDEPIQGFASVWDALADTPEQAANMRLRAELALAIQGAVEGWGENRTRAAERLRLTQPHLAELLEGRLDLFSVDELATLAERAGLAVEVRIAHAAE